MLHDVIVLLMNPIWTRINLVAVLITCSYAIVFGAWRERFGGAFYMAASLIVMVFVFVSNRSSIFVSLVADVLCLPGFLTIDRKSPKAWTRWALICQMLSIAADMVNLIGGRKYSSACLIALGVLSYGVLGALLVGTVSEQVRRHRERAKDHASKASARD